MVPFAETMTSGAAPDSSVAMDVAERHRQHIGRWFYDCSYDMHRGLGDMYVADPRFTATYDDVAPGLAVFVRESSRMRLVRVQGVEAFRAWGNPTPLDLGGAIRSSWGRVAPRAPDHVAGAVSVHVRALGLSRFPGTGDGPVTLWRARNNSDGRGGAHALRTHKPLKDLDLTHAPSPPTVLSRGPGSSPATASNALAKAGELPGPPA